MRTILVVLFLAMCAYGFLAPDLITGAPAQIQFHPRPVATDNPCRASGIDCPTTSDPYFRRDGGITPQP